MTPKFIRKLFGVTALVIALGMSGLSVGGNFTMGELQSGLVIFCGLGGMWLVCS